MIYQKYIKRFFDILLSLTLLLLFSPLYLILAALVYWNLGQPVLFRQMRPGKKERLFQLYKFRTMTEKRNKQGKRLSDKERLTPFGKWLRKTSLDELPELWNILKGDMSFVGPRPLLVSYLPLYNNKQRHRHDVRPGLTGLAQIHGRNETTWEERFQYDLEYVRRISWKTDLEILIKTIEVVWKREGIHSRHSETMERFQGNKAGNKNEKRR